MGAIAPFFGPVGAAVGAGAGALGGLISSNQQQGVANKYAGMSQAQIKQLQDYYNTIAPVGGAATDMALGPAYNYQGPDPYSEDFQDASYQAYGEDATRAADSGVSSLVNDYATRGIIGGTGINTGIQGIRSNASSDLARYRSGLRERGAVAKQNQFNAAEDARFQRLQAILPQLLQTQGALANGIGGQQSIAQGNANSATAGIGGALGQLAASAGSLFGAGNNRTGTNQNGSNPYQLGGGFGFTPPFMETPAYGFTGGTSYGFSGT